MKTEMRVGVIWILVWVMAWSTCAPLCAAAEWKPDWEHLRSRPYPKWFTDAKLGIFIHWGVYSVPAYTSKEGYGEWFLRGLQLDSPRQVEFQKRVFGEDFIYRDYAPLFKAELFDPNEWAGVFKHSGAHYVVLVSKHHDGYCLWPSQYAPGWNSVDVGPRRDIVGELTRAVRATGLKMGLYYSLTEWNNSLHRWYTDPHDQIGEYVEQHMFPQWKELVGAYRPSLIFSDGEWFNKADDFRAAELISWYYNLVGDEAIVNDRWGHGSNIGFRTPEYSAGLQDSDRPWAEVRGLGRSFALNRNEKLSAYMTADDLIEFFIKAVAFGGGIIINVGPRADGQIPLLQQERLLQLGQWLQVNGEAIYGCTTWKKRSDQKDVTLERIDPTIDFDWKRNTPGKPIAEDHFTATWTGFFMPLYSEAYRFEAEADDGMRLWIDDRLVLDQWEKAAATSDGNTNADTTKTKLSGVIELQAGKKVPIRVEYFEKTHGAAIKLLCSSDSQAREVIPTSQLFTARHLSQGDGLKAAYRSKAHHICYTRNNGAVYAMVFDWPGKVLELPISLPSTGATISLVGRKGHLDYQRRSGKTLVDLSGIYPGDLPCQYAWAFKIEGLN